MPEDSITTPENTAAAESTESTPVKKQHGGYRPGAGRKKDVVGRLVSRLKRTTAAEILEDVNPEKVIREIFAKGSLTLKQRTLADLWDRAYGKPAQSVQIAGSVVHWTPETFAHLTPEEWAVIEKLYSKPGALPAPGLPELVDIQPPNQESKPS